MSNFYKFKPVDTLFFKGAEPMNMGEDHTSSSVFPPSISTIIGAVRTAYLKQHTVDFKDYEKGKVEPKIFDDIGEAGREAPFSIIGPFFKRENNFYIPAPYNWYMKKSDEEKKQYMKGKQNKTKIIRSEKVKSPLIKSSSEIYWVKGEGKFVSLGGRWININDLYSDKAEMEVLTIDNFADSEQRTGIQLEEGKRIVKEGHLYSFTHKRLRDEVEMVFGIDSEIDINEEGILKLGGEQRFGKYKKIGNPIPENSGGDYYLSLSVISGTELSNKSVISTGKIQYMGGWDMKKGFHKDLIGYFPAGTVFNTKIDDNLLKF